MGFESHYDIGGAPAPARPCPSPLTVASSSDYTIRAGPKPDLLQGKVMHPPVSIIAVLVCAPFFLRRMEFNPGRIVSQSFNAVSIRNEK